MALPMLVSGSDCGPANPLQGLTKRLDHDRGTQQDLFASAHAGPSRQNFRSQRSTVPGFEYEAAQFFSPDNSSAALTSSRVSFNLSEFRNALPAFQPSASQAHRAGALTPQAIASPSTVVNWASEFLGQHSQSQMPGVVAQHELTKTTPSTAQHVTPFNNINAISSPAWSPPVDMIQSQPFTPFAQPVMLHSDSSSSAFLWDREFRSQELMNTVHNETSLEASKEQVHARANDVERDELARTAGLLMNTVKDEQNPKFKNSQFFGLMRQLRDGDMVVSGNDVVASSNVVNDSSASKTDYKGKGKEIGGNAGLTFGAQGFVQQSALPTLASTSEVRLRRKSVHFDTSQDQEYERPLETEQDPNEAYFEAENTEYMNYWNAAPAQVVAPTTQDLERMNEWGFLQDDWDSFEATASGIKMSHPYNFQEQNPYLHGNSTKTRNHMIHVEGVNQSFQESVLELEAVVQREPRNAVAWFDLGVKQQENEREPKAIIALQQALQYDPDHLPAWLALAISHTNENNRTAADDAIEEWALRNTRYAGIANVYKSQKDAAKVKEDVRSSTRRGELIECLLTMARSSINGDIDADVQIALAVLLNTSEDYQRAQDCFRTALAVRPDDWQLYNRVGATLANSGSAEEALQYYYRALELNPVYIRARFNLGISCINMRRYEEAAQHILDALVLQDSDGAAHAADDKRGITSSALWDSLKTTCLHLQRIDLATLCDRQDLNGLRHEFHV